MTPPATRKPVFFRITVGLLVVLLLFAVGIGLLLAFNIENINRSGGWGWLLAAGVFVVLTTIVCAACAVCSAVSLWKGEAHRRFSTVVLIGSCLVVWVFGPNLVRGGANLLDQYEEASRQSQGSPQPVRRPVARSEIPDSLVQHFQRQGVVLRPAQAGNPNREWIVDNVDVGTRCEVVTSFRLFPLATPVEIITKALTDFSTPSILNEQVKMAMFHPHARGTTSDVRDCEEWPAKSKVIVERLQDAFRSYRR